MHASIREEVVAAMSRVYDSQWYVLAQFGAAYSGFNQVAHTVGVGNGLEALTLTLRALPIGPGNEVLVPSNAYITTWLAVSHVGATPMSVEPDPTTSNLDCIVKALMPRTRASY